MGLFSSRRAPETRVQNRSARSKYGVELGDFNHWILGGIFQISKLRNGQTSRPRDGSEERLEMEKHLHVFRAQPHYWSVVRALFLHASPDG